MHIFETLTLLLKECLITLGNDVYEDVARAWRVGCPLLDPTGDCRLHYLPLHSLHSSVVPDNKVVPHIDDPDDPRIDMGIYLVLSVVELDDVVAHH